MKGGGLLTYCEYQKNSMWKYNRVPSYLEFQTEVLQSWLREVLSLAAKNTSVHAKEYLFKPDRIL